MSANPPHPTRAVPLPRKFRRRPPLTPFATVAGGRLTPFATVWPPLPYPVGAHPHRLPVAAHETGTPNAHGCNVISILPEGDMLWGGHSARNPGVNSCASPLAAPGQRARRLDGGPRVF